MPLYEFRALDGTLVERWFSMDAAPEIGSNTQDAEWGEITRIPSGMPAPGIVRDYANVGASLPKVWDPRVVAKRRRAEARVEADPVQREELLKSAEDWERSKPFWKKTDAKGKPVFETKRDVDEFQARTGDRYRFNADVD